MTSEMTQYLASHKYVALPTGCATCTTFRHRHSRQSLLIETVEVYERALEIQEKIKGGCLFFEGGKLVGAKKGCAIEPCSVICCRRPLPPLHANWRWQQDAR